MKTAAVLNGAPKFATAYEQLVNLGYPGYALRQRNTFPPESVLHFEDQLALWSYWNLLKFEKDPQLRSVTNAASNAATKSCGSNRILVQFCLRRADGQRLRSRASRCAPP
jgi:hypothetical protein